MSVTKRAYDYNKEECDSSENKRTKSCEAGIFHNVTVFILETGVGKARMKLFQKRITSNGGEIVSSLNKWVTHIIVDENMTPEKFKKLVDTASIPPTTLICKTLWLSHCLKETHLVATDDYEMKELMNCKSMSIDNEEGKNNHKPEKKHSIKKDEIACKPANETTVTNSGGGYSDYEDSGEEDVVNPNKPETSTTSVNLPRGHWACASGSSEQKINHNKHITDKLEGLAKIYENTNDRWRSLSYQKAINTLKKLPNRITSFEEAKALHGVGEKLALKIWEIIESGELRKLDELSSLTDVKILETFTNVWGAGPTTARSWMAQGFRTLDEVREKGHLTSQQKIGLKHYDDILDRMPHSEAGQIESFVKEAALKVQPGLVVMACGSYRRKKETCGDVDVLISHPDGTSHKGVFHKLLDSLRLTGFLTDDLVSQEDGNQRKYLGVCRLPGPNQKHRRLDIIVVPYNEFACALMYFTGSAHFNRSMRHLAGKMGMSLNEHSLNTGVVRKGGEKLTKGVPVPTPTEESIFNHLGLTYRPPEERNH